MVRPAEQSRPDTLPHRLTGSWLLRKSTPSQPSPTRGGTAFDVTGIALREGNYGFSRGRLVEVLAREDSFCPSEGLFNRRSPQTAAMTNVQTTTIA
jgi:hypothetical protein